MNTSHSFVHIYNYIFRERRHNKRGNKMKLIRIQTFLFSFFLSFIFFVFSIWHMVVTFMEPCERILNDKLRSKNVQHCRFSCIFIQICVRLNHCFWQCVAECVGRVCVYAMHTFSSHLWHRSTLYNELNPTTRYLLTIYYYESLQRDGTYVSYYSFL